MQRRIGRRGRGGERHLPPLLVGDGPSCVSSDVLLVREGDALGGRTGTRGTSLSDDVEGGDGWVREVGGLTLFGSR